MSTEIIKGSLTSVARHKGLTLAQSFLSADAIVLIDTSGSMGTHDAGDNRTRYAVACNELARLQAENSGKLAVVAFSDSVQFCPSGIPPYLGANTKLAKALKFIKPGDACGLQVILISDGEPNAPAEALKVARGFKSRISTIYVGPEGGAGQKFLAELAAACNGQAIRQDAGRLNLLHESVERLLTAANS